MEMAFRNLMQSEIVCYLITNTLQNLLMFYIVKTCDFEYCGKNEVDVYLTQPREPVFLHANFDISKYCYRNISTFVVYLSFEGLVDRL